MKHVKHLLLLLWLMGYGIAVYPQTNGSTTPNTGNPAAPTPTVTTVAPTPTPAAGKPNAQPGDSAKAAVCDSSPCCIKGDNRMPWHKTLLVYLPLILFVVFSAYFIVWLRKSGFELGKALSGDTPAKVTQPVTDPAGQRLLDNTGTPRTETVTATDDSGKPVYPESTSRLILFLTGIATLCIVVSLVAYYAYFILNGCTMPDLSNLLNVLLTLGIGVVPYAVNKLSPKNPA